MTSSVLYLLPSSRKTKASSLAGSLLLIVSITNMVSIKREGGCFVLWSVNTDRLVTDFNVFSS